MVPFDCIHNVLATEAAQKGELTLDLNNQRLNQNLQKTKNGSYFNCNFNSFSQCPSLEIDPETKQFSSRFAILTIVNSFPKYEKPCVFIAYKPSWINSGPGRLPLLGSMPLLPKEVRAGKIRMSTYLKEKYGNIVGMYAATRPMIFISDYNYVKDLYKLDVASDRPNFRPFHELRFGKEDGLQRGLTWQVGDF